jgi:hypothetical protein
MPNIEGRDTWVSVTSHTNLLHEGYGPVFASNACMTPSNTDCDLAYYIPGITMFGPHIQTQGIIAWDRCIG